MSSINSTTASGTVAYVPITGEKFSAATMGALLGISNSKGVPGIAASTLEALAKPMELDVDAINQLLSQLQQAVTKENTATAVQTIKMTTLEQKDVTAKAKKAQEDAAAKAKEAADAAPNGSVMNWIMAAVAIVGAAVAVAAVISSVALGGWATVFAVAVAVVAVSTASMAVANAVAQDQGTQITNYDGTQSQMDISWGGMVNKIVDQQLKDGTMVEVHKNNEGKWVDRNNQVLNQDDVASNPTKYKTAEQISDWKMGWTITTSLLIMLATIACGYGAFKAAGDTAKMAGATKGAVDTGAKIATAAKVERGMEVVGGAADLGGAGAGVYTGVKGIEVAQLNADTERARADKAFFDSMLKDIVARMKLSNDMINQLVSRMNEVYDSMFANLATSNRTIATIANNVA